MAEIILNDNTENNKIEITVANGVTGGAWGEITGTLENQIDLQNALDDKVDKVTGKGLSTEDYTTTEKNKLASITEIFTTALKNSYDSTVSWISTNGTNLINHLTNTDNPHSVTKTQVGLGNAENTSDLNKPISTATQTALDGKVAKAGDSMTGSLVLQSSNAGGQNNFDSTSRIETESYQNAVRPNHFAETFRLNLPVSTAKNIIAWTQTYIDGIKKSVAWIVAHGLSNDGTTWHNHISIEVPDETGQLQTQLEIPFAKWNEANGYGISSADVYVRSIAKFIAYGDIIKEGEAGTNRQIRFMTGSRDATNGNRWAIRTDNTAESGSDAGSDFRIVRYADNGSAIDSPIVITRSTGDIAFNSSVTINSVFCAIVSTGTATFGISRNATSNFANFVFRTNQVDQWSFGLRNVTPTGDLYIRDNINSRNVMQFNQGTGALILSEISSNPTASVLTSGSNAKDKMGFYMKNDKLVFAYNNSGTVTYLSIPLDGSTTTWTHNTTSI